jgi:phage gp46-like protein
VSDIALQWDNQIGLGDFVLSSEGLATEDGLRTAIILSLFTNAPAKPGDVLPDGKIAKGGEGGWWANELADVEGDVMGSRLWLLARAKDTKDNIQRAGTYIREALQWMIDDSVLEQIDTVVESVERLALQVSAHRPDGSPVKFRFPDAWAAEEARI